MLDENPQVFVEEWPLPQGRGEGQREVSQIVWNNTDQNNTGRQHMIANADSMVYAAKQYKGSTSIPDPPLEAREKMIQRAPYRYSGDRGSACCFRLEREYFQDLILDDSLLDYPYLLVGISHVKSFRKLSMKVTTSESAVDQKAINSQTKQYDSYGYLSRFYAFLPASPPVDVVALSPFFCFPPVNHGKDPEQQLLQWKLKIYQCPAIHFVSGMAESVTDPTKLILGYGINDVLPHMIVVQKRDIASRLFSPVQPRMTGENVAVAFSMRQ